MVQKTEVILTDDTDGTLASETVRFALDRSDYEIDLNDINALALRETLARYIASARRVTPITVNRKRTEKAAQQRTELREWAEANGIMLSPRGRIPADIYAKWDLARQAARGTGNGKAPQSPAEPPAASPAPSPASEPARAAEPGSGPRGGKQAPAAKRPRGTGNGKAPQSPAEPPAASPAAEPASEPARAAEPGSGPGNGSLTGADRAVIRAWARLQGISIGERGRISAEIIDRYRAAH